MKQFFRGQSLISFLAIVLLSALRLGASAQCPPNIDFEQGSFAGWKLYVGSVSSPTGTNQIDLEEVPDPVPTRHTLIFNDFAPPPPDQFGGFSTAAPNGSVVSVKLGNESAQSQAEGMSYDFTIPAGVNQFSLTYYYAVVFQDPGHTPDKQPRLDIEVTNLTDNVIAGCSSFSFIASSGLPGFFRSTHHYGHDTTAIWCRDWSANTINLDNSAGKTFQLFFKTADCVPGGHFGYAYIDVSSSCSSSFVGAAFCPGDTSVDISGPAGYHGYRWFDATYSTVLGTRDTLHLSPPPPTGSSLHLEVTPYPGYGCTDTLTAQLVDTLHVHAFAGADVSSCDDEPVKLGEPGVPGLIYHWQPTAGLSNPNIANPFAAPDTTITYTLTVKSPGAGCVSTDDVTITKKIPRNTLTLTGDSLYCTGIGDSSVLHVYPADSIQWYQNGTAVPGAHQPDYHVTATGDYSATLFSSTGCSTTTPTKHISVYPAPHASFTLNRTQQCSPADSFIVTNQTTLSSGNLQYAWNFGDGRISSDSSPVHIYPLPGNYLITLHASSDAGCSDDTSIAVVVKPGAAASFSALNVCVDLTLPVLNHTKAPGASAVNYLWSFGDGSESSAVQPVYQYSTPGEYNIRLLASTPECADTSSFVQKITVTSPTPGIRYPDLRAIINFHEPLPARHIGTTALWSPATYLDNPHSYTPEFRGASDQQYLVTLTTPEGCVTVDTVAVKVYKKIAINVPTAFSPNGDGRNDVLRPVLFGFNKVNYFRVYNRWGKLLFESHDDQQGWDGRVNGVVQDLQTVIWTFEGVDADGVVHTAQGSAILMR